MTAVLLKVCQRYSSLGIVPLSQASCQTGNMLTVWKRNMFYKKKFEFDRGKVMQLLYDDHSFFSFKGLDRFFKKRDLENIMKQQKYNKTMFEKFGPDLWVTKFVLGYKGKIKIKNDAVWLSSESALYNNAVEVEGIDASSMVLLPPGLDNLRYLKGLRYIKFGVYITDWYLFHIQTFSQSLEFVDISGCKAITDAGISSLVSLKNLKCLDMTGCTKVKNADILAIHLQTHMPDLVILGLGSLPNLDKKQFEKELQNNRLLNIGESAEHRSQKVITGVKISEGLSDSSRNEDDAETLYKVVSH